jgi:hypothetical protein
MQAAPAFGQLLREAGSHGNMVRQIVQELGGASFHAFAREVICALSHDDFADTFFELPADHQKVAWRPPPGVVTDIQKLLQQERIAMAMRINEIRRQRCVQLSTPNTRKHWEDEGYTFVPMSRWTCKHFWAAFRLIPLGTTDPVKWGECKKYLEACPAKPDAAANTHVGLPVGDFEDAEKGDESRCAPASPKARSPGEKALAALPAQSPPHGRPRDSCRPKPGTDEYKTWLAARIEADTANLAVEDVEIDASNKLAKPLCALDALKKFTPLSAMSAEYDLVFKAYHKKFVQLLDGIKLSTKSGKALSALAGTLNIDLGAVKKMEQLPELLARFRAMDIMKAPDM